MRKVTLVALASVVIVAGPAFAGGGPGGGGPGHGGPGHGGNGPGRHDRLRSSLPTRVVPHHQHNFFQGQRSFPYGGGYGVFAPPVVGYGYGTYAYSTPAYAVPEYVPPPPTYYPPSMSYAPPPMQTVIEFPNGRYVLEGDGMRYRWVWVPNPPPAPPADEPSATPPPPAPSAAREPVRNLDYYRWTDDEGVTHFSDRLERVPEAYRSKVTKSRT